eukprot:COSAG02_NODE_9430_length_2219_cov_1.651887_1_plen_136_part_10
MTHYLFLSLLFESTTAATSGCSTVCGGYRFSIGCLHLPLLDCYVNCSAKLFYYCVEWDDSTCSWNNFRSSVLGPTDPADAPVDSLRGLIAARWKELGLPGPCDVGDNAVHASASPFEAMVERCNWLTSAFTELSFV